ncbi:MAG: Hsp70 family protein, partial [Ktedonobacterales bacterium]
LALGRKIQIEIAKIVGGSADDVDLSKVAPSVKQRAEETVARDNNLRLDVVRQSANMKVTNVVSHSFGIVVTDGTTRQELIANLVKKNDKLPVELTKRFGTLADGQTTVEIRVMENDYERDEVQEINTATELGTALIENLPRGLASGSPIDVTFELNQQGRLRVFGLEPTSGQQAEAVIQTSEGMSEEDVQAAAARMKGLKIN